MISNFLKHRKNLPNSSARTGNDTRTVFKQNLKDLNSEFSFTKTGCHTMDKESSLSDYLLEDGRRIIRYIPFRNSLVWDFELRSLCWFSTMITVTQRAPPTTFLCIYIRSSLCVRCDIYSIFNQSTTCFDSRRVSTEKPQNCIGNNCLGWAHLAGPVEYTYCISASGLVYDTKQSDREIPAQELWGM